MENNTARLDKKAIRVIVKNKIEAEYPHFSQLKRKEKREVVREAGKAVEKALKCGELVVPELTQEERLGLGKVPADIMSLEDMARFIDDHQRTVLSFSNPTRTKYIKDPLLKFVDKLLDDSLLDRLFVCAGEQTDCPWSRVCPKERVIPIDTGYFGPLPSVVSQTQEVIDFRKVTERPFNLIKHHDGLEPCRMRTQATVSAQALFSQMLGIFKVMASLRAVPKTENQKKQEVLPMVVNG